MPGPPRKPTRLRVLEGDPGKLLRRTRREPKPAAGPLTCPGYLDRYGRDEWRRIASQAQVMGYAVTDVSGLAMACDAYSVWRRARAKCRDRRERRKEGEKTRRVIVSGLVHETAANGVAPSAWSKIAANAQHTYLRFMAEFGFSPAARTRIETEEPLAIPKPPSASLGGRSKFFDD